MTIKIHLFPTAKRFHAQQFVRKEQKEQPLLTQSKMITTIGKSRSTLSLNGDSLRMRRSIRSDILVVDSCYGYELSQANAVLCS